MKSRLIAFLACALVAPLSSAWAQDPPTITKVIFKAGSPTASVVSANAGSGVITVGCTGRTIGSASVDRTCAGVSIPINGRVSPPAVTFVQGSVDTAFSYTKTAPGQGCGTLTLNIYYGAGRDPIWSGCAGSWKFTLTLNANGSVTLAQN